MIAPAYMGSGAFRNLPDIPKAYGSVTGRGHFFWASNSSPGEVDDLIVAWLKLYLADDPSGEDLIQGGARELSGYQYEP